MNEPRGVCLSSTESFKGRIFTVTSDRVVVQYKGKKMEEAGVLELFTAPKSPYTRALLAALPENATGDRLPTISGFDFEETA